MTTMVKGTDLRLMRYGTKVDRATATLPQTTVGALFTVVTGRIILTGIVGQVTTVIQTQANATKLISNPTVGTDVDLCATLDITAKEVGGLLGITGTFATALVGGTAGATVMPPTGIVVPVGTIDLSCAASNTGSIKWSMTYFPLDDGAYVEAA
jgi:hypothetical protein